MADTVATQWIHPANWDGTLPETGGWRKAIVHLTGTSDGTGEKNVVKVDISSLQTTSGLPPTRTVVEKITYRISGMTVTLTWDRSPRSVIAILNSSGQGEMNWNCAGGLIDMGDSSDGTGDILLTSSNIIFGGTYDMTLYLRLKDD